MSVITITRLDRSTSDADLEQLAALLVDAIESGAGVSFMAGLTIDVAAAWWRSTIASLPARGIVLVARDASGILGTVQLQPAWAPNQPHRPSARSRTSPSTPPATRLRRCSSIDPSPDGDPAARQIR